MLSKSVNCFTIEGIVVVKEDIGLEESKFFICPSFRIWGLVVAENSPFQASQ